MIIPVFYSPHLPYRVGCIGVLKLFDSVGVDTRVCDNRGQTVDQIVGKDWRNLDTSSAAPPPASPDTSTSISTSEPKPEVKRELKDDVMIEEGYMLKGTGLQKKKRYFVLSNSHLLYFKGRDEYTAFRSAGGHITFGDSAQVEMRLYVLFRIYSHYRIVLAITKQ